MGRGKAVEVVSSKGCTALLIEAAASSSFFRNNNNYSKNNNLQQQHYPLGCDDDQRASVFGQSLPFAGLVICVTGLSKETRKQVRDATQKLGGIYSPNLHPRCTHLVLQSAAGLKRDMSLKHASTADGLYLVTIGWFVDSVRRKARLSEELYRINNQLPDTDSSTGHGANGGVGRFIGFISSENPCLPANLNEHSKRFEGVEVEARRIKIKKASDSALARKSLYIDAGISAEKQNKVVEAGSKEGATFVKKWHAGCNVDYVVCEGTSARRYLGESSALVTAEWVLKTAKAGKSERLVRMSSDLAKQVQLMLQEDKLKEDTNKIDEYGSQNELSYEERQEIMSLAKNGVRSRRGVHLQTCLTPVRPVTPTNLLDSICWDMSEPAWSASTYTDYFSSHTSGNEESIFADTASETSFVSCSRPLNESEKSELVLRNHILTILFPIDRYAEMGPSSRSFFSEKGFTCLQVLDHIYAFYQENLSVDEVEVAIQRDSRHADLLRLSYSSKEAACKRIDLLGTRTSFEMLKPVTGDNYSNVYELLIRT